MREYKNGWRDYWNIFDELIDLLKKEQKTSIVDGFKEAQKYVNGLTDGWYEYKFAFEETLESNKENMTKEQIDISEFLMRTLNDVLNRR